MLKDSNLQMIAMINDLDALIAEIDNNPCLSPWVVRLILKAIKDKAKKTLKEPTLTLDYRENVIEIEAFRN